MLDLIRQMADDLHSAAESLRQIERVLRTILTLQCVGSGLVVMGLVIGWGILRRLADSRDVQSGPGE